MVLIKEGSIYPTGAAYTNTRAGRFLREGAISAGQ
tara:strand:+ start:201 stop:305 length:105 start_codon:yes stop_codon:yes gene_type:complete